MATLSEKERIAGPLSLHAKGLAVVTDKMAAPSGVSNDSSSIPVSREGFISLFFHLLLS